ncbi:hypothetical protein GCM10009617_19590 [Leifsonia poae]|uniref:Uncharacterized protein n=1 Tax=Leifsonia poae TaxID=110933 RepID=A0A9W6HCD9_9MICO|nr:hypothetical protein GCM10017584_35340 [Leifsonia poae]
MRARLTKRIDPARRAEPTGCLARGPTSPPGLRVRQAVAVCFTAYEPDVISSTSVGPFGSQPRSMRAFVPRAC